MLSAGSTEGHKNKPLQHIKSTACCGVSVLLDDLEKGLNVAVNGPFPHHLSSSLLFSHSNSRFSLR